MVLARVSAVAALNAIICSVMYQKRTRPPHIITFALLQQKLLLKLNIN